ncbi:hypothetical protein E2562_013582 [Oryza meyeriana var. granulata]|uniref:BTB domain-containing protein n=1 Tax=Oryza meyeriana var. granulata TaxID=110450 RepID=A0A6G1C5P3_9ORYZ|nr:hypothetical protein E2562_013582 [Oryza meyeriana var. granulata]
MDLLWSLIDFLLPSHPPARYAVTATPATVSHLVRIDGYSRTRKAPNGEFVEDSGFIVGDRRWYIQFYPNGHGPGDAGAVSIYVGMARCDVQPVVGNVRFSLVDSDGKPVPLFIQSMSGVDFSKNDFGMKIKRPELEASGCLNDDGFTVLCELAFVNGGAGAQLKDGVKVPPSNLHRHLADLLWKKQGGGDVSIEVQGKTFTAHRWMLAARSAVMAAELSSSTSSSDAAATTTAKETTTTLRVDDDMDPEVFRALLHFIYTDALPDMTKDAAAAMATRLHVAAGRYRMERLQLICEDTLCKNVNVVTRSMAVVCLDYLSCQKKLKQLMKLQDDFYLLTTSCPSVIKELFGRILECND